MGIGKHRVLATLSLLTLIIATGFRANSPDSNTDLAMAEGGNPIDRLMRLVDPFGLVRSFIGWPYTPEEDPLTNLETTNTYLKHRWTLECGDDPGSTCLDIPKGLVPHPPRGFIWKRLSGGYTFSAFSHADEQYFSGDQVEIPGILGLTAKEDFLFGVDGVGMQGSGVIWRLDANRQMQPINIRYIAGHWELDGQDVIIEDYWYYAADHRPVDAQLIPKIRLVDARFAISPGNQLIPYYSVAAPPRFDDGTLLYVPELIEYGGLFEVQDRGGAYGPNSRRFDVYVGKGMGKAVDWLRLGARRSDLAVYQLLPSSWN